MKLEPGTFNTAQTRCRRSNRLSHESVYMLVNRYHVTYTHIIHAFILLKQQETIREINGLSKTKTIVSPQTKLEISYQYFSFSQNSFIVERSLISSNDLSTEAIPFSDFSSMNDTLSNLFKVI